MADKISKSEKTRAYDRGNGRNKDFRYYENISMIGVIHTIIITKLNLFFVIVNKILGFN